MRNDCVSVFNNEPFVKVACVAVQYHIENKEKHGELLEYGVNLHLKADVYWDQIEKHQDKGEMARIPEYFEIAIGMQYRDLSSAAFF